MSLPDSIDLTEDDFYDEDHEDIVHEQAKQSEVKISIFSFVF